MKCPHCLVSFHEQATPHDFGNDNDCRWRLVYQSCPAGHKYVIFLLKLHLHSAIVIGRLLVYPKAISRTALPADVPDRFAQDYKEACLVLADSPKASAALSRRCLQNILRDVAGIKPQDLSKEIDEVLASKQLPSQLAEGIDAVRHIGNFAAHPIKSKSSGEIVDVEPGEAEWQLDVLEGLFDHYFIAPAELKRKREALNKKLEDAGKPPLK